jgi:hypothetical protein
MVFYYIKANRTKHSNLTRNRIDIFRSTASTIGKTRNFQIFMLSMWLKKTSLEAYYKVYTLKSFKFITFLKNYIIKIIKNELKICYFH